MNGNGGQRMTLREQYGRKTQCWEQEQAPIVTFTLDSGEILGFPFFGLAMATYIDRVLSLSWPAIGTIQITGVKSLEFYRDFSQNRGTWLKADGQDIVSVILVTPAASEG